MAEVTRTRRSVERERIRERALPAVPADRGYLFLVQNPLDTRFAAPGLDLGYFLNVTNDSKND